MLLTATLALVTFWSPAPEGWTADYALAAERAKNEHKLILIDFTGSDWCEYCHKLDEEIFSTAEFKEWAKKNVELLQLDYPHNKPQPDILTRQNEILGHRYSVTGFPTIFLTSPDGTPITRLGYEPTGPAAWIAEADQALKAAKKAGKI